MVGDLLNQVDTGLWFCLIKNDYKDLYLELALPKYDVLPKSGGCCPKAAR